jgi:mycothiol S-conjugate amidase
MSSPRCLLTVHAHPDDESSKGAATVARYHAEGVHTVLVCCTGGEEGEILNPALNHPDNRERVADLRRAELARAASIIGYDDVVLLGYRDSGMPDTPANRDPRSFAMAPFDEALERLVAVVRRTRPEVIITYPAEQSRYPHPDHLRVHEISVAAFDAAADRGRFPAAGEAFGPSKLYYSVWPVARHRAAHAKFLELGLESPYKDRWFERLNDEEHASTHIDIADFDGVRMEALRAHATQVDPSSPFWFGLPPEVSRTVHPYDAYQLARSRVGPLDVHEDDLFEGIGAS